MKSIVLGVVALLLAPLASGQSFNVDVGASVPGIPGGGVPSPDFGAAAHQAGVWNAIPGSGAGLFPLVNLSGTQTRVVCRRSDDGALLAADHPWTTGNFQLLMDDAQHTGALASTTYYFIGLDPGRYLVTTYAWSPLSSDMTNVTVIGATTDTQSVGGNLLGPDTFTQGVTHVLQVVEVDQTRMLTLRVEGRVGGGTINGVQLSHGYQFVMSQGSPGSALNLMNCGGLPGNYYLNLISTIHGDYPNGWLFGIDMPIYFAVLEVNSGPPFFGPLDVEGSMTYVVPGVLPAGMPLYCVGLEVDPAGPIASVVAPFEYVVQ